MVSDNLTGVELRGSLAAIGSAIAFAVFTVALRWGKSVEMLPAVFLSGVFGVIITGVMCLGLNLSFSLSQNDLSIAIGISILFMCFKTPSSKFTRHPSISQYNFITNSTPSTYTLCHGFAVSQELF